MRAACHGGRGQRWGPAAGLALGLLLVAAGTRAEPAPSLQNFLRPRGYEPVQLQKGFGNRLFVEATLGGKPVHCLVDTGAALSCVHPFARTNSIPVSGAGPDVQGRDAFGHKVDAAEMVLLPELQLGRCRFFRQPAVVVEWDAAGASSQPPTGSHVRRSERSVEYRLILGLDFLVRNFAILNCGDGTMKVGEAALYFRGSAPDAALALDIRQTLERSGYRRTAVEPAPGGNGLVSGSFHGQTVRMILDTGSPVTLLDRRRVKVMKLRAYDLPWEMKGIAGGRSRLEYVKAGPLRLGDCELPEVPVGVVDLSGNARDRRSGFDGYLGMELLEHGSALLDCHGLSLYTLPRTPK